jgi:GNAT superfamily N-acetyltransferase
MPPIRRCRDEDFNAILEIINAAAQRYRGQIPDDRWHDPYMTAASLQAEIEAGVDFWVMADGGRLTGVMGIQPVRDVVLIRHAYVLPGEQGKGIGGALLEHLRSRETRPILIGTWADAIWAIRFYERHAFTLVSKEQTSALLHKYWSIPERQVETSVVLTDTPLAQLAAFSG